jgi:prepilin-type processing-associated H-X9-DG protein
MYTSDSDGFYPQTKDSSNDPALFDSDGSLDEPDYASIFTLLAPYSGDRSNSKAIQQMACPEDTDPMGNVCLQINPDTPVVTSYVINGYFVFGLNESAIPFQSNLIAFAERRSDSSNSSPFCDYVYHPWFNSTNSEAPENQMDPILGAIATQRHNSLAHYQFADGHSKGLHWAQTFALPTINLHKP